MKATGWLTGLEVSAGGTGIVSHAGVALVRALADKTGLTGGLSRALASRRLLIHDRGRVLADLACAIADGAEVISDFRVMADQGGLFGLVASVPTCWRALDEIAGGGSRVLARISSAVNAARRQAWQAMVARHGALPGIAVADKTLAGVTCIRLDASVVTAHSGKELAEPNYKGFGHHPLLAYCDNTGEPLAGKLRRGGAGSNTVADHLEVLEAAITALPPAFRRRLMVTCDGAGASHGLIERLDELAARPGHQLIYSVGWDLGERERTAIAAVPGQAWQIAIDHRGQVRERRADDACADRGCGHRKCWVEEAHVTELTGLLRKGPAGDQLAGWPATMRVFARRERPHPGAQLTLFEAEDGWRYSLWVTNLSQRTTGWRGQLAYIDAAHRVHARVEDCVRTGKDTGISKFPSQAFAHNQAWLAAALIAATLLCWLKLLALDGNLAKAEPKTLRYRILHAAARLAASGRRRRLKIAATWPWAPAIVTAWDRITALPQAP
ncbi:MAG TPA: IS1380 family transposase [Actinomycetes bacterium]|nr:IS1380 family transposase [Actinomycetes bacterium]